MTDSQGDRRVEPPGTAARPVVFVVDADVAVREGLEFLFTSERIAIETFASAEEFLARIGEAPYAKCFMADAAAGAPACSACLVCEVNLPGLNGLELLEQLERHHRRIPAIMLASDGNVRLAVRAMQSGALDFIEKPFVDRILLRRVKGALRRGPA